MAEQSLKTNLIFWVKGQAWLYRLLRWIAGRSKWLLTEVVRFCGAWRGLGFRLGGPWGFFSGWELLQQGGEGRLLFSGQELPALPSGLSLIRETGCNQNGRQPWPVFWLRIRAARLAGPSLAPLDTQKRMLIEAIYGPEFAGGDPSNNYMLLPAAKRLQGSWTSVISHWCNGYYHWFNDALPRLATLAEFPPETGILLRGPLRAYQRESLEMLGLLNRVRETPEKHLVIEDYYFSSPPGMTGCTNPYVAGWLRENFLPQGKKVNTPAKFFVKRRGKTRGIRNQEEVVEFFLSAGWGVVDLEELSLAEQISWFANAEVIVGEHGGGFTNLVWCRLGTRVLELCPDNFLNGCYEGISLCNGLRHQFRIFKADSASRIQVPLRFLRDFVGNDDLSACLEKP
jgi:hypothetical protein